MALEFLSTEAGKLALANIPNLVRGISGIFQTARGNRLAENNEMHYEIPDEVGAAVEIAKRQAGENIIPGQGYYENQIARSASSGLDAARLGANNPGALMEAAININQNTNASVESLAQRGLQFKQNNIQTLIGQLNKMAEYRDREFKYNEFIPYQNTAQRASALMGAGRQNMFGALDDASSNVLSFLETQQFQETLRQLTEGTGEEEPDTMSDALQQTGDGGIDTPISGEDLAKLDQYIKDWGFGMDTSLLHTGR